MQVGNWSAESGKLNIVVYFKIPRMKNVLGFARVNARTNRTEVRRIYRSRRGRTARIPDENNSSRTNGFLTTGTRKHAVHHVHVLYFVTN